MLQCTLTPKSTLNFFFLIQGNSTSQKAYFMSPGERVKYRLSQTITRSARP